MKIEQNIARLNFLLKLYKVSEKELLDIISKGLKKPLTEEEIFSKEIKLNHLKRIDKFFNKGLHYYLDPKAPEESKEVSIFFRKQSFNTELNIGAKKIVNHFEEFKISLSAIAKLAELEFIRAFPIYSVKEKPRQVANEVRKQLYPNFTSNLKQFLKALISRFAENNILVFEFVEYWNQIEKANIDGFFLNPNVIVLKRQQVSFRREIFTLAHELGHFLINEEEIEELDYQYFSRDNLSKIEKWCSDFSYYFLIGEQGKLIDTLEKAEPQNDYYNDLIDDISSKTHLSKLALYTRLLLQNKISKPNYNKIKADLEEKYKVKLREDLRFKERKKELGIKQKGSAPQPIKSPLLISTIQTAFYEGLLSEYEVCKRLNIKPEKFDEYIQ